MCVQEPCVYLLSAASVVIRNSSAASQFPEFLYFYWQINTDLDANMDMDMDIETDTPRDKIHVYCIINFFHHFYSRAVVKIIFCRQLACC